VLLKRINKEEDQKEKEKEKGKEQERKKESGIRTREDEIRGNLGNIGIINFGNDGTFSE
jgi:hypothetical protein